MGREVELIGGPHDGRVIIAPTPLPPTIVLPDYVELHRIVSGEISPSPDERVRLSYYDKLTQDYYLIRGARGNKRAATEPQGG